MMDTELTLIVEIQLVDMGTANFVQKVGLNWSELVFTGPVHWTKKTTETKLNPTA